MEKEEIVINPDELFAAEDAAETKKLERTAAALLAEADKPLKSPERFAARPPLPPHSARRKPPELPQTQTR